MVGKSENDRPVAPGPPENRVSPLNTAPSSGAYQHTEPGGVAGGVQRAQFGAGDAERFAIGHRAKVLVRVRHPPQHIIAGMEQYRRVERFAEFGGHGHVVVVAVCAHHRHHVAPTDGCHDRRRGVRGVEDHDVGIVAEQPDVVVDFPTATVEFEGAMGDDAFDVRPSQHHHRAQHLAVVHFVERLLDVAEADAFGDELLQRQPALQVEVDQGGEVAFGQAVAVPG